MKHSSFHVVNREIGVVSVIDFDTESYTSILPEKANLTGLKESVQKCASDCFTGAVAMVLEKSFSLEKK